MLQDPVLRKQEAEDALRRRGAARQAQEQKLAGWIDLLKGSGTCSAEQFGKICGQFEGIFSEHEIRARFAAVGIRVEAGPAGPKPPRERTDPVTAKNIRQNLELLGLASLYQFLGLAPGSPAERLRARAEEILKEIHRLGRTDALTATRSRLAGTCMTVFQSEEEKKKYDNERLLEAVEAIEDQIKAAAVDKVLSAQEIETLIRLATQRGVPPDEVREVLEERAAKEGWKREARSRRAGARRAGVSASLYRRRGRAPRARPVDRSPDPRRTALELGAGAAFRGPLPGVAQGRLRTLDEGDGTLIAQTSEAQADDATVPFAVPWHYAVFSLKNGLASGVPAHSGPHFVAAAAALPGAPGNPAGFRFAGWPRPVWSSSSSAAVPRLSGGTPSPAFWRNGQRPSTRSRRRHQLHSPPSRHRNSQLRRRTLPSSRLHLHPVLFQWERLGPRLQIRTNKTGKTIKRAPTNTPERKPGTPRIPKPPRSRSRCPFLYPPIPRWP